MGSLWDVLWPGYGNKIYRLAGVFRACRLRRSHFGRNTAWGSAWIRKEIRFGDRDCRRGRVAILYPQLDYPRLSDLPSSARLRPVCTPKYLSRGAMEQFHEPIRRRGAGMRRGVSAFLKLPFNLTYHTANF